MSNEQINDHTMKTAVPKKTSLGKLKLVRAPYFTFVYSSSIHKHKFFPPLALGVIKSHLEQNGFHIEIDDLNVKVHHDNFFGESNDFVDPHPFYNTERVYSYLRGGQDDALEEVLARITRKTDLSGVSVLLISVASLIDISPLLSSLALAKFWKKHFDLKIVMGGAISHDQIAEFQDSGIVNHVIEGPGEKPLVDLLNLLQTDGSLESVPGLRGYRPDGSEFKNVGTSPMNIIPDFTGLPFEKYSYDPTLEPIAGFEKIVDRHPIFPLRWMVSCPFNCAFCCESAGDNFSSKKPEEAVDYIQALVERHGARYFHFLHSTHNLSKAYTHKFCDEILRRGLKIFYTDCACVRNTDLELLKKMREAGCIRLIYGMESASPRMLQHIGNTPKVPSMEHAAEALRNTHEAGIWTGVEIITGLPTERQEDCDMTIDFLNVNREYIDTIFLNPFFLDNRSLMLKFPEKYGIENIRAIDARAKPDQAQDVCDTYFYPYAFDEINGLKWAEKRKQIIHFESQYRERAPRIFWSNDTISLLFHLYDNFGNKAAVRKIYNEWAAYRAANPMNNILKRSQIPTESGNAPTAFAGACVAEVK